MQSSRSRTISAGIGGSCCPPCWAPCSAVLMAARYGAYSCSAAGPDMVLGSFCSGCGLQFCSREREGRKWGTTEGLPVVWTCKGRSPGTKGHPLCLRGGANGEDSRTDTHAYTLTSLLHSVQLRKRRRRVWYPFPFLSATRTKLRSLKNPSASRRCPAEEGPNCPHCPESAPKRFPITDRLHGSRSLGPGAVKSKSSNRRPVLGPAPCCFAMPAPPSG